MCGYEYNKITESCLIIAESGCSVALIILCEVLINPSVGYIEDNELHNLLIQHEINIYGNLYNWLKNDEMTLKELIEELLICCNNNIELIIRWLKEIKKHICVFGKIEYLIHHIIQSGEYSNRIPSEYGLYKIKFINGFYLMDISNRLNLLFSYNDSITKELIELSNKEERYSSFSQSHNITYKNKDIEVRRLLKEIEFDEIILDDLDINKIKVSSNLKNIIDFIINWKIKKDINSTMNDFYKLMQGNVIMLNKYQFNMSNILNNDKLLLTNTSKSFINQISMHSLIEAKILFTHGFKQQASQHILHFLYSSFKTKSDSFICVCLAYSLYFISQLQPIDHGFDLILKDLIEKSEHYSQYDCLTYAKLIKSLYKTNSNFWNIMNEMIQINISDYSNLLAFTIYRSFFWNIMGFKNLSSNILKALYSTFFQHPFYVKKYSKLYASYLTLYAFSLFQSGNITDSISMLKQFIHSSTNIKEKKTAINCLRKIEMESLRIASNNLDHCYSYSCPNDGLSKYYNAIKVGDYLFIINNIYKDIINLEIDSWEKSYCYVRALCILEEAYYLNNQHQECLKIALHTYTYACLKNLYSYASSSLIYICDSLLQLRYTAKVLPFLQLLIGRYYSFLSKNSQKRIHHMLNSLQSQHRLDISAFFDIYQNVNLSQQKPYILNLKQCNESLNI